VFFILTDALYLLTAYPGCVSFYLSLKFPLKCPTSFSRTLLVLFTTIFFSRKENSQKEKVLACYKTHDFSLWEKAKNQNSTARRQRAVSNS